MTESSGLYIFHDSKGYETVVDKDSGKAVRLHQIISLVDHKASKVFSDGKYVTHHENECPFDNRPENLKVISGTDHRKIHANASDSTADTASA